MSGKPPLIIGIAIIAGTSVGAGMFSLPIVSSGMWFSWSLILMFLTWFCMFHSSLMILEANLNFEPGASFNTFIKATLGKRWNTFNNLTLAFVLYILAYAYISGGGSIITHTLNTAFGVSVPPMLSSLLFAAVVAFVVWYGTGFVGRITAVILGGMVITFLLSVGSLMGNVEMPVLLDTRADYAPYLLAAVPYYLTSFGFHGNVPSLVKYYGKDPARIRLCLLYGSLLTLVVYLLWQLVVMGNIPRGQFGPIISAGGNIGDLVSALGDTSHSGSLSGMLNAFANMAVVSSFLGVTLGLFDFISDRFGFDDSRSGRLKTAAVTFLPPTIGGVFFPDGFLYAIGLAGLTAAAWGTIVPAHAAKVGRQKYGNPLYRVWGGNGMIYFVYFYGGLLVVCYTLAALRLLPVYE
jgi:tryptophan-specific transport protein